MPSSSEQSKEFDAYKSQCLPHYEVSFKSLGGLLKNNLDSASKRTLKDRYDYYPQGFKNSSMQMEFVCLVLGI